ncbi:outer membrane protein [Oharaeibacter diazotrophicus]|uniref:Opacity protein-like surface antigen n=1 Tax=Oharaeibacter diazotrophicus TaxID=1920512 RepID=A0A4R6RH21_9HYPH|nr:outer membrane protein [Oharaeibacter diazotrophicus]TDP85117.1 opacity protein-like surface antigen [Oharaeibacter diazotrophicus]BBE74087.1 outer membrane protein PagN precursor [Pleomorphomonas sp. SM30]GLS76225.1 HEAT resistant agglutinin 1 protein [Oharaeibacter diazotrophicus]
MRSLLTASTFALAAAIVCLAPVGAVRAADMPEYPPVIDTPEPLPLPAVGGWYLRGDIGYKVYGDPEMALSNSNYAGFDASTAKGFHEDAGDAFAVGIGAGYKFNDYLRADVTLDYETPSTFSSRLFCPGGCTDTYSREFADISAWSALVNGYVDLGTYYGVTPYVGAGIGASYLLTDDVYSRYDNTRDDYKGDGKWNFAWALMAGASYAINPQWSVDLGYRYLNLGDAQSGVITAGDGTTTRIDYKNIDAHEVRLGLRYNLY